VKYPQTSRKAGITGQILFPSTMWEQWLTWCLITPEYFCVDFLKQERGPLRTNSTVNSRSQPWWVTNIWLKLWQLPMPKRHTHCSGLHSLLLWGTLYLSLTLDLDTSEADGAVILKHVPEFDFVRYFLKTRFMSCIFINFLFLLHNCKARVGGRGFPGRKWAKSKVMAIFTSFLMEMQDGGGLFMA
jgi:hypothetical protein